MPHEQRPRVYVNMLTSAHEGKKHLMYKCTDSQKEHNKNYIALKEAFLDFSYDGHVMTMHSITT